MNLTKHSKERIQQRGARMEVVEFIYENGKSVYTYKRIKDLKLSAKKYFVNKKLLNSFKYKKNDIIKKYERDILNTIIIACPKSDLLITVYKTDKNILKN